MSLSLKYWILHFVIYKVLFPLTTNFTQITNDKLFYIWIIKTQVDFNFPYLIMKYMFDCLVRKDIGYLSYEMILTPFFKKDKLKINEELQVLMPNATTMIIVSNLHKMHLILGDDSWWVKACIAPLPPPNPPTVG